VSHWSRRTYEVVVRDRLRDPASRVDWTTVAYEPFFCTSTAPYGPSLASGIVES
jgi:hypothetical protein